MIIASFTLKHMEFGEGSSVERLHHLVACQHLSPRRGHAMRLTQSYMVYPLGAKLTQKPHFSLHLDTRNTALFIG